MGDMHRSLLLPSLGVTAGKPSAEVDAVFFRGCSARINHDDPEDGVDFDVVPNKAVDWDVKIGLSNSFGFGGHNSSVVFGRYIP